VAWIDDRIWCHPKITGLTNSSYRAYVNGIAYSSGMGTQGRLDESQMKLVGAKKRDVKELIFAQLWDENADGSVTVHDWDEHNSKRDERRQADRERKRLERAKTKAFSTTLSAGQTTDSPQDKTEAVRRTTLGQNVGPAHVEARADARPMTGEGSEEEPKAVALSVITGAGLEPPTDHDRTALDQFIDTIELRDIP
jgi:hypothetical protein